MKQNVKKIDEMTYQLESYLLNAFDECTHPIFALDDTSKIIRANKRAADLLGYKFADDLVGTTFSDFFIANDHPESRLEKNNLEIQHYKVGLKCNGEAKIFLVYTIPLNWAPEFFGGGTVLHVLYDTKKIEDSVLEASDLLKAIIDTSPMRIFWKDLDSRLLGCNQAFASDAGVNDPNEIIGKLDTEMIWAERAAHYRVDDLTVMSSGVAKVLYEEEHFNGKNKVWVRTSKFPIKNAIGEITGLLGVYSDITEQKKADQEFRIAAIAFNAQEPIIITDNKFNIIRVNKKFMIRYGHANHDALKLISLFDLLELDTENIKQINKQLESDDYWHGDAYAKHSSGSKNPADISISAVKSDENKITHYVISIVDSSERKASEHLIKKLAFSDSLTELPNRRVLIEKLDELNKKLLTKDSGKAALIFIDLDHFKKINDTFGHKYGDLLLQHVSKRLTRMVRKVDTVARLGGDEFVVLLDNLSEDFDEAIAQAQKISMNILSSINKKFQLNDVQYQTSASLGVTIFDKNSQSTDDLVKQADIAMYKAKSDGRNLIRFFDPQLEEEINNHVSMENELHDALSKNQFCLHYQPQIDSNDNVFGYEALLRWEHPNLGLLGPFHFIDLLEQSGLIIEVGYWIIEEAIQALNTINNLVSTSPRTMSVNVSPVQFADSNFVERLRKIIHNRQVDPRLLKLELTENMLIDEIDQTILTINRLKDMGVSCSLDDFGTGFSSLQYLKKLPLSQLKIDQSFVRDIEHDINDQVIVKTIIEMAKNFGLSVIAEGVENENQVQILLNAGCNNFQGYLFSKPIALEEVMKKLDKKI